MTPWLQFGGTDVQDPRFRFVNEAGLPELLGYWELCMEDMARIDVDTKAQLETLTPVDNS